MPSSQEIIYKEKVIEIPKFVNKLMIITYAAMLTTFFLCLVLGAFFLIANLLIFGLLAFFSSMSIGAIFNFAKTH